MDWQRWKKLLPIFGVVGGLSLRELLHQHHARKKNYDGKSFMCTSTVKELLTHKRISDWIENHHLHQHTTVYQQCLITHIVDKSRLLFAILVMAELEHLISALYTYRLNDDSLPEIDCSAFGLSHDEQLRLDEQRYLFSPVLRKTEHLYLSPKTTLPFMKRRRTGKNGSFGQIFEVEVAGGHLEGYDEVKRCIRIRRHINC